MAVNPPPFVANYGQAPLRHMSQGLIDAQWLLGLSGGNNQTFINGLTSTGTTAADAFPVPSNVQNVVFSTVAASTGALLPFAIPGTRIVIFNHDSADALTVYAQTANNPLTGSADQISTGSGLVASASIPHGVALSLTCAAPGIWN